MKRNCYHKIDPCVRNLAKASSGDALKVILYARQFKKCLPVLKDMGIEAASELPLINGYIVEIPPDMLSKLAGCRDIRYVAADLGIKTQKTGAMS